ncbi:MAG: hypothetical protein ACF8LL_11505 [Phycisphaerales bacterium]
MARRLFHFYQRNRIININANIICAGLLAIALSKLPVHWMSQAIGPGHQWLKAILAGVIDAAVDIALYFVLHWVANHWRPLKPRTLKERHHHRADPGSFWKNASLVQAERYLLSPLFYVVAVGGMWALASQAGIRESWAFVISFSAAIILTRVVHTEWGLYTGRFDGDAMFVGAGVDGTAESSALRAELVGEAPTGEAKPGAEAPGNQRAPSGRG